MSLIQYPNLFFDLSSIADEKENLRTVSEMVKKLIDAAPSRVVFGSDYSGCSQREHIDFIKGLALDSNIEDNVFWNNARNLYQI